MTDVGAGTGATGGFSLCPRRSRLLFAAVCAFYLCTRAWKLAERPVFVDEALHIEQAKVAMTGDLAQGLFLGKWLSVQSYALWLWLLDDRLVCARMLPVVLGFVALALLRVLGQAWDGRPGGPVSSFAPVVYAVVPMAAFYDRIALCDQFLTAGLLLLLLASHRLCEGAGWRAQVGLGAALLLVPLFKMSAFLFLWPVPLCYAIVHGKDRGLSGRIGPVLRTYAVCAPLGAFMAWALVPRSEFAKCASASLTDLARVAVGNMRQTIALVTCLITPCLLAAMALGAGTAFARGSSRERRNTGAMLAVLAALVLPNAVVFADHYPRYHLPMVAPLCMLGGAVLGYAWAAGGRVSRCGVWLRWLAVAAILAQPVAGTARLLADPLGFKYTKALRCLYVEGFTSGYGLEHCLKYLRRLSEESKEGICVLRSPEWDLALLGADVHYRILGRNVERITLFPWSPTGVVARCEQILGTGRPCYLLFDRAATYPGYQQTVAAIEAGLVVREDACFARPGGRPGLCVWRLWSTIENGGARPDAVGNRGGRG